MCCVFCQGIDKQPILNSARLQGNECQPISDSGRSQENAASLGSSTSRIPKSPWMPFPMLFAAISSEVPPKEMDLVNKHYELFRVCLITNCGIYTYIACVLKSWQRSHCIFGNYRSIMWVLNFWREVSVASYISCDRCLLYLFVQLIILVVHFLQRSVGTPTHVAVSCHI